MNRKRTFLTRTLATALCVVMLLTLCSCKRRPPTVGGNTQQTSDNTVQPSGDTAQSANDTGQTPAPTTPEPPTPVPDPIDPSDIVDTFNIALVVDTSASLEASDPYGLALRSAVTFLESMYAGNANQERMLGAKHANVNIITYNDTANSLFGQLYSLDDAGTVDQLIKYIYGIKRGSGGDIALGDALETAVNMFSDLTQTGPGPVGGSPMPPPFGATPQGMMGGSPPGPPPGMPFGGREQNLIILFTDGYSSKSGPTQTAFESIQPAPGATPPSVRMISSTTPQMPQQQEREMPNFGGATQAPLERALKKAQQRQCEIIVLGLNPEINDREANEKRGFDTYWSEFKKIANYTQMQMGPPDPPPDLTGTNPVGDQTNPFAGMPMPPPPPPPITGRVGGGMFDSTDSDFPVNYKEAKNQMEAQRIYIQIASAMLQGTGTQTPKAYLEDNINRYECEIKGQVSAAVFYVLSSDPNGVNVDDLIDPDGISWHRKLNEDASSGVNGWNSDRTVRRGWYAGCCVMTVPNPTPGVWKLKAHPSNGDRSKFAVHMTQIGGVEVEISFKQNERFADDGKIFVRAKYQGEYMSKEFYDNATASCELMPQLQMPPPGEMPTLPNGAEATLTSSQDNGTMMPPPPGGPGGPPQMISLSYDAERNAMVTSYRAPLPGPYNVNVIMNASDVEYRASGVVNFEPKGKELYIRRKAIKLTPELTDSWKDIPLTVVSYEYPRELLNVERSKRAENVLELEGVDNGVGELTVVVKGVVENMPGEQTWTIKYPVTVAK